MHDWESFATEAPAFAAAGRRLIDATGIAFLATIRQDGAPRLHPIVPIFADAGMYVAVNGSSPKRHDLRRDGRYALHASLGPDDEELAIDGLAAEIVDSTTRDAVVAAAGHVIHDGDVVFEFLIARCLHTIWERAGQPGTRPLRQRWPIA